jgi:type VI secretion system secreted protein VgrG
MPSFTQAQRPLKVTTPLSPDALLLVGLTGQEGLSQLFTFQLDLIATNETEIAFDKLLGQPVAVSLAMPGDKTRNFHGICCRVSQGAREEVFTSYRMDVVPQLWLLTRRAQSRIFQHITVPDILKKLHDGIDVDWQIQGKFEPRDYCVQYRETDFNFVSRLMEEEGIYYYFKHSPSGHKMVVANTPQSHADVPGATTIHFTGMAGGRLKDDRIFFWEKMQELRSGKYTLWDHCFELPHKHLEADKTIPDSIQVGTVTHKQKVGSNDKLEIYDFPGEYAQRFDGINKNGGEQPADIQKIFDDNKRTVGIRMQQEAVQGLVVRGRSDCRQLTSGHKFTLDRHFNADGQYVLTCVQHTARLANYLADGEGFFYENSFTCIPFEQPYRPPRTSPRPVVQGSQTAVVVGPPGEEIFCDKYSRVKVQFHWDREGKLNGDSSCWVRVSTLWAGKQWGVIHIPRIGQEVIIDFLEGDPDQPIITGSVYNAEQMPPYKLPDNRTQSGIKSRSSLNGSPANFNEIRFEDKKGSELVTIHAEKDQSISVEHDESHTVGHDRSKDIGHDETTHVGHNRTETVDNDETITIHGNRTETVDKNETITIHGNRTETVDQNESITVSQNRTRMVSQNETITVGLMRTHTVGVNEAITVGAAQQITVGAAQTITVGGNQGESVGGNQTVSVGNNARLQVSNNRVTEVGADDKLAVAKNLTVEAGEAIVFKTGDASITLKKDGTILIDGKDITVTGSGEIVGKASKNVTLKGQKIHQN